MKPRLRYAFAWPGNRNRWIAIGGIILALLACSHCNGQTYQVIHNFADAAGSHPGYGNLVVCGTTLYGTACGGGISNCGVIFRIDPNGSNYTILKQFLGGDGADPQGTMLLAGTNFFGVTEYGGDYDNGVLYKIGVDGSGYAVLHHFDYTNGGLPCAGVALAGSALYGTTSHGGTHGWGTIYRLNTDGNDFSVLHHFDLGSGEGAEPIAELTISGSTLFGTTAEGNYVFGSVFRINTDGSGFQPLHVLTGGDGKWPVSTVALVGNTLFGTADWGGLYDMGTLFQLNTDGTGFTVVKHFTGGNDGAGVEAGLLLSGPALYGTTYEGGDYPYGPPYYGHGVIFRIKTDGSGFEVLKTFTGSDGGNPRRSPVLLGNALYGLTDYGGISNNGVIYSLSLPIPYILAPPRTQTAEVGTDVRMVVKAEPRSSLWYQWYFNNTPLGSGYTSALSLPAVQQSQSGVYQVVVTNSYGAATSPPAMLAVIPAVTRAPALAILLTGAPGSSLQLAWTEMMDSNTDWHLLDQVTLNRSSQYYIDPIDPWPPSRFYRAQVVASKAPTVLRMLIPMKLTLSGAIGSQAQIDCISPIGPTDAWNFLASVTLTNPVQPYYDFDACGKPPRLYRVLTTP